MQSISCKVFFILAGALLLQCYAGEPKKLTQDAGGKAGVTPGSSDIEGINEVISDLTLDGAKEGPDAPLTHPLAGKPAPLKVAAKMLKESLIADNAKNFDDADAGDGDETPDEVKEAADEVKEAADGGETATAGPAGEGSGMEDGFWNEEGPVQTTLKIIGEEGIIAPREASKAAGESSTNYKKAIKTLGSKYTVTLEKFKEAGVSMVNEAKSFGENLHYKELEEAKKIAEEEAKRTSSALEIKSSEQPTLKQTVHTAAAKLHKAASAASSFLALAASKERL